MFVGFACEFERFVTVATRGACTVSDVQVRAYDADVGHDKPLTSKPACLCGSLPNLQQRS